MGLAWAVAGAACNGTLGSHEPGGGSDGPGGLRADNPASATRFRRLTHQEWSNTVHDLLGIDASELTASFRNDPRVSGFLFDNNSEALEIDQALASAYQRAAAQVAERVTQTSADVNALVPTTGGNDEERARAFIHDFGRRVHRRPLTDEQVTRYLELYQAGLSAFDEQPGFVGGIRLLMEAFLQSPYFLYRVESSEVEEGGVIPLDGWERAQRLSYFLWATMPDDELFAAAESGELMSSEVVASQARRMLAHPRAGDVVERLYAQLFEVDRYERIAPSPNFFPDVSESLAAYAAEETRRFVRHVMFEEQGTVAELLTSTTTFVNQELARLYGLQGDFDADFKRVELDVSQRRGILTQIGFLASHATSVNPDPIHRGIFVASKLNCLAIAAPPDALPPLPEPGDKTNREIVEEHTEAEGTSCRNCHSTLINPFGFPFESYDAVGAFRTQDNGKPVNTVASPPIGGQLTEVADAIDLAEAMASNEKVHQCIAKHLLEFAHGRRAGDMDEYIIQNLGTDSAAGESFREMMVRLVTADSFLNRSTEDLP